MVKLSPLTYRLAAAYGCFGAVLFVFGPCITAMAETFRVPLGRFGLLWSFYALGLTPAVLLAGYCCESIGRKPLLLGAVSLLAVSCALLGLSPHLGGFWTAMLAMSFLGVGGGTLQTVVLAAVADDNQPAPEFALNLIFTVLAVGAVLAPAGASALLRARLPWEWAFFGLALLVALLLPPLRCQHLPDSADDPLTLPIAGTLLRAPMLWLLIAATTLYSGAECGLLTWVSAFAEKTLGVPRALAGLSVSVFWAMMIVGRATTTVLVTRVRLEGLLAALACGAAVVTAVLTRAQGATFVLLSAAAAGLFMSGIAPLTGTDTSRQFTQYRGPVYGLMLSGIGFGSLLPPALMGVIASGPGLRTAMLLPPALLAAIGLIYLLRLRVVLSADLLTWPFRRRPAASPPSASIRGDPRSSASPAVVPPVAVPLAPVPWPLSPRQVPLPPGQNTQSNYPREHHR